MPEIRAGSRQALRTGLLAAVAIAGVVMIPSVLRAVATTRDPPTFTDAQATAGKGLFAEKCSSCHGADLRGGAGPALSGAFFEGQWIVGQRKVLDLFTTIKRSMPLNAPRSLSDEQYSNVVAYLLSQNGYRAKAEMLAPANMDRMLSVTETAAAAPTEPPAPPRASFPQAPVGTGLATTAGPDDAELSKADDANWLMYNKSYTGQRFSGLDQINVGNAARLTPTCIFQPAEIGSFQAAPIVYGGLMYITTPYNTFAINPATCAKAWEHNYPVDSTPVSLSRGAAIYKGKLFRVMSNGHLVALDARTGKLLWDVWLSAKQYGYWLSAAPVAYDGMVFMGTAGADWGANGVIYAFDADTGKKRWSFNVIPAGKEIGAKSWKKGAEKGGGSFWSSFAIDREKGLIFVPIGNPAPDFNGALRPGDNLFTNSVVALDVKTGKLAWWVQQVPHDVHDWDTAAAPTIYNQGMRGYMAVANKGGWLYLYDRGSHKLIAKPEISPHDNIDAPITTAGVHHCPGNIGGAEWNGAAYSPPAKALYINSVHWCGVTRLTEDRYLEGSSYFDGDHTWDPIEQAQGFTRAFDAATGKELWSRHFNHPMLAAITPTAGGVLFTGTLDGDFLAMDAKDGKTLYRFNTGGAVASAPSTYLVDGKQYVAIASGNNSRSVWRTGGAMMVAIFSLPTP
jgi:alcohol dehydrogenase (cytochrome c)